MHKLAKVSEESSNADISMSVMLCPGPQLTTGLRPFETNMLICALSLLFWWQALEHC